MFRHSNTIAVADSEVWKFIQAEADRQEQHIELIASETTRLRRLCRLKGRF